MKQRKTPYSQKIISTTLLLGIFISFFVAFWYHGKVTSKETNGTSYYGIETQSLRFTGDRWH